MAATDDNKATCRRIFDEIVNHGKLEVVDELFDPDFRTVTQQGTMDREGFKEYVRMWRAGFPDVHCDVDDLIAEDDRLAWSVRATGTQTGDFMGIPPTGNSVDFDSLNVAQVRDGRLHRHTVMMDIPKIMSQLGVGS